MTKHYLLLTFLVIAVGCGTQKIPNYKLTPKGAIIYRYSKKGEPVKDILSNGDTLILTPVSDTFQIKHSK